MTRRTQLPLLLTLGILVILVTSLIAGGLIVRSVVATAFRDAEVIRTTRVLAGDLLEHQLDEETGVRGFAVARQPALLEPYYEGRATLSGSVERIAEIVDTLRLRTASIALDDAAETNRRWLQTVALPIVTGTSHSRALGPNGKRLIDRFRTDINAIDYSLARREAAIDSRVQLAIGGIGFFVMGAIAAMFIVAGLFSIQQYRMGITLDEQRAESDRERQRSIELRAAYAAEKRIADTLQNAFVQRPLPQISSLRLSATYVPAAEEAKVGGDWYDAFELPHNRVLLTIGDVTGHGIEAAVAMNKARQAMIFCALIDSEPGRVLERVNADLIRDRSPIVTAVAGLVDATTCRFEYAVAGHPSPLLIEPGRPPRLLDCGSLPLGFLANPVYQTHRIQTVPGAMLVLYTDGVIEHSRNVIEGERLLLEAVERAARDGSADVAAAIRDGIFGANPATDDVAILTIRFAQPLAAGVTAA